MSSFELSRYSWNSLWSSGGPEVRPSGRTWAIYASFLGFTALWTTLRLLALLSPGSVWLEALRGSGLMQGGLLVAALFVFLYLKTGSPRFRLAALGLLFLQVLATLLFTWALGQFNSQSWLLSLSSLAVYVPWTILFFLTPPSTFKEEEPQ